MTAEQVPTVSSISLADVVAVAGLALSDVLLIRHPLSNARVREALEADQLRQYTSSQGARFPGRQRFWLVFLGEEGRSARYVACYENAGILAPGSFDLSDAAVLPDLVNRLVVDWGPGTRSWWQNGPTAVRKPVLAIMDQRVERFPGFENLVLTFRELEIVVIEPRRYAEWHAAMFSVNAVYLIVDAHTGKHYVGSAYGVGGLLGRWKEYVATYHGHNVNMVEGVRADPSMFQRFQFSVLQILPKSSTADEVVAVETLYKRKLLSKEFGVNAN